MRPISASVLRPYVCPSCGHGVLSGRRRFASTSDQIPDIYDVVCVGGGPAGLGLLAALSMNNTAPINADFNCIYADLVL